MAPRKKCGRVCRAQLSAAQGDEAPPFVSRRERTAFDARVDETLRANGFEPSLSPIAERWVKTGHRTVLIARIHSWSPHLVEFYLEGRGGGFPGDQGRLIEAGRSNEQTFKSVLFKFLKVQREHERDVPTGLGNYPERSETMQLVGIEPFKTCTFCGRPFTKAEWDALPLVGHQRVEASDGEPALVLELKNCPHDGSTQAVPVADARGSLGATPPTSFVAHAEQLLRAHNFVPSPNFRARGAKFWSFYSDHFQLGIYLWEHGAEFWIWEFLVGPGGPMAIHMNGEVHAQDFDRGFESALATLDSLETKWEPR